MRIRISVGNIPLEGELFETPCGKEIMRILPIEGTVRRWGDEIYFEIPLSYPLDETATTKVKSGHIGYWPPGRALALFFGPTPLSNSEEPVPASEVNLVGRIKEGEKALKAVKEGERIRIEGLGD